MKILFVHKSLSPVGGIETLILRLLRMFHKSKDEVSLLLYNQKDVNCEFLSEASKYVENIAVYTKARHSLPIRPLKISGQYDVIYCFGWRSFLLGILFRQKYSSQSKVLVGVYQSRELCWDKSLRSFGQKLIRRMLYEMPKENIIFMNDPCKEEHETILQLNFKRSPIVPLALEGFDMLRSPKKFRIVSIGRLVDFKQYNFFMLDVVLELRQRTGLNFEYHVYGDGECAEQLHQKSLRLGLDHCVSFHGTLPYDQMPFVLESAWVFVGMGTSLLEAAMSGVPSIIAIESERQPVTYGFIHELSSLNCGEKDVQLKVYQIRDKFIALSTVTDSEYDYISRLSKEATKIYHIDTVFQTMCLAFEMAKKDKLSLTFKDRFLDSVTGVYWKFCAIAGFRSPLKNRYLRK